MAYFENSRKRNDQEPLILLVPGLNDSGPDHWQSRWERNHANAHRVDLGMWDDPHRNTWVNKLNLAIHRAGKASLRGSKFSIRSVRIKVRLAR